MILSTRVCWLLALSPILTHAHVQSASPHYEPTWDSLDKRPLPEWYDEAKLGIFIHWGVFSVAGFGGAWLQDFWTGDLPRENILEFIKNHYPPDFTYADWAKDFKPWYYDPVKWADIFKKAGAKYVVLTSKHCEGFCNFPSPYSFNWNSKDVGPNRDLVGELVTALRNTTDLKVGLYYAHVEFVHPLYLQDRANKYTTQVFPNTKIVPEMKHLVRTYKPDLLWADAVMGGDSTYWNSTHFLAWLYNDSPVKDTIITNDRYGTDTKCKHGGYWTCTDKYNPGKVIKHKWENCMTIDKDYWAYQYNREISDYLTINQLIATFASTVSYGGNMLMNVSPTKEGSLPPVFQERLMQMGAWLDVNGEAIYSSHPCTVQNDTLTSNIWYTCKDSAAASVDVFAIMLEWPDTPTLSLGAPIPSHETQVTMLGFPSQFSWKARPAGGMDITVPTIPVNKLPTPWAWVFKIDKVKTGMTWTKAEYRAWQEGGLDENVLKFQPGL